MEINTLANTIKEIRKSQAPFLIAIEGFGGSGKTTLAEQLKQLLGNAYVVNIDDFIVKEKLTEPLWDKGAFDRKRLEIEVLMPARAGLPVQYEELIWETNTLRSPKVVPKVDYLIIEGISSYHPDIAHYYDYKVWVNTPIQIAKQRGQARDDSNENAMYWDLWAENDLRYQMKYHPETKADYVIDNGSSV